MTTEVSKENGKSSKSCLRRLRKKKAKERRRKEQEEYVTKLENNDEVEHPSSLLDIQELDLKGGFSRFILKFDSDDEENVEKETYNILKNNATVTTQSFNELPLKARAAAILQEDNERDDQEEPRIGKKKMKELNRMSTAKLKIGVDRPELVETWDYCSRDPLLLLELKAMRNTVPVPRHWCAKRKYLQGKRGFEKAPFKLPDFIAKTGIMEMRQTVQDRDTDKSLKTKMREKIRPRVGHVDIDYNKLHDAFFKDLTKPSMTIHGDIYYEGKEFEVKLKEKKPGQLSDDVRTSLGLPTGPNADKYPPPWLIAMQRYGPPPSYPNLKIPGLNAPIPYGCSFGYHANGWGKPPVDETGRPIYGDVFMDNLPIPPPPSDDDYEGEEGNKMWGEIDSDEEEEEEGDEMEESEEDDEKATVVEGAEDGMMSESMGMFAPGLVTPGGGTISIGTNSRVFPPPPPPTGLTTPQNIELRKKTSTETAPAQSLFQVLPHVKTDIGEALIGSTKIYQIPEPPQPQESESVTKSSSGTSSSKKRKTAHTPGNESGSTSHKSGTVSGVKTEEVVTESKTKKHKEFKF